MSTTHQARSLFFGSAVVFAFMLLGPVTVKADEEVAVLAPVVVPPVDETNADAVRAAAQVRAAQQALRSPDLGSLQEEHLRAIVAAAPSEDATSGCGSVEARRVLVAQQALRSPNLGSLQEEALIIVVTTGAASDETQSVDDLPAALASGTRSETAHLATLMLPD
jgi:hypothetical protein